MTKPILFLDNNTISSLYGRASGDVDRFIRLLNGLNEQYDLRVTDVIYCTPSGPVGQLRAYF